jgi:murein L,D-transpeptidase YcbB/YkuD
MMGRWTALLRLLASSSLLFMCAACAGSDGAVGIAHGGAVANLTASSESRDVLAHRKSIVVNIAAYELTALQDGVPVFRSRVIVGRPASPTPELTSSLYAIQFNPAWFPTPSMIRDEGAHYAPPGPQNPLGRILFELDNDQLIYLHDTNDRRLFNQDRRALSHGCVRVEQAGQLAAWALGVPLSAVDEMISRGATHTVPLPQPIPVSLVRQATVRPHGQGQEE